MLALVAGPSGAGKDSVISSARKMLAGDSRYRKSGVAWQDVIATAPNLSKSVFKEK